MTNDYRPIACGLYDEFELLAIHGEPIELEALDGQGRSLRFTGRARDLRIRDGAEYLVLEDGLGRRHELRLDRLVTVRARRTRWSWRQNPDELRRPE
jgi:transcriptional antiterminator Rof (Rho-off)